MKPPPFRYLAPPTLDEALGALADAGAHGKVLAGGQSLIPLLNMRLAAPGVLVDINGVAGLGGVEVDDTAVRVGATVRHAELERHAGAHRANPLLRQALRHVAHPVIRNRGTTVGSVAHADPAGEMPAVLAVLGGHAEVAGADGTRRVDADALFVAPLESALEPGEVVTSVAFPNPPPGSGTAFAELARRHGDYAVAGVAAVVTLDDDRHVAAARVGYLGVGGTPIVVDLGELLAGRPHDALEPEDACAHATDQLDPGDDIHATATYRRHLAGVLTHRALVAAAGRAAGDGEGTA